MKFACLMHQQALLKRFFPSKQGQLVMKSSLSSKKKDKGQKSYKKYFLKNKGSFQNQVQEYIEIEMREVIIISSLIFISFCLQSIQTNLYAISFSPTVFNLTFSEPVVCPAFQLILNNMNIQYNILTNTHNQSSFFLIEVQTQIDLTTLKTQTYSLLFNYPLSVGKEKGKSLPFNKFVLYSKKKSSQLQYILTELQDKDAFYSYQNQSSSLNVIAICIAFFTYFACLFNTVGLWMISFIQIYAYVQLHSPYYTYLDYKLSFYLLFQIHQSHPTSQVIQLLYICMPFFMIFFSFILGIISRFCFAGLAKKSWGWKIIYEYFTYKFFLIVWRVLMFPLFVNTLHVIYDTDHFVEISRSYLIFYMYFGILVTLAYFYLSFVVLNPRIGQSESHWEKYKKSLHFKKFIGFYCGLKLTQWYKRNFYAFLTAKRVLIGLIITFYFSYVPILIIQTLFLFYLFIIKPYRYDFYSTSNLITKLIIVIFYCYCSLTNSYFGLGQNIHTSYEVNNVILSQIVLFCLIVTLFLGIVCYQIYDILKQLRIQKRNFKNSLRIIKTETQLKNNNEESVRKLSSDSKYSHSLKPEVKVKRRRKVSVNRDHMILN